jgi:hypothetical protein
MPVVKTVAQGKAEVVSDERWKAVPKDQGLTFIMNDETRFAGR